MIKIINFPFKGDLGGFRFCFVNKINNKNLYKKKYRYIIIKKFKKKNLKGNSYEPICLCFNGR